MATLHKTTSIKPISLGENHFVKIPRKLDKHYEYPGNTQEKQNGITAVIPKTAEYGWQLLRTANLFAERINACLYRTEQYDELMAYDCHQIIEKVISACGAEYVYQNYKAIIDNNESIYTGNGDLKIGQARNQPCRGIWNIPIVHEKIVNLFDDIDTSLMTPYNDENYSNYLKECIHRCLDYAYPSRNRIGDNIPQPEEIEINIIKPTRQIINYCRHLKGLSPEFIAEMPHLMTLEEIQAEKRKMSTTTLIENEQESDDSPDY